MYDDERRVRNVVGTNENDATVLVIGVEVNYEADEDEICIIVAATSAMTNDPGTLAVEYDTVHVIYYSSGNENILFLSLDFLRM